MKKMALLACFVGVFGNLAVAAEAPATPPAAKGHPALTTEQRQKMAGLHDKMAVCLRSTRPLSECRQEMMAGCKEALGKEGCAMMGHGKHHHEMDEKGEAKE
jgi:hypothetical protein